MLGARLGVRACKTSFQWARQLTYRLIDDRCQRGAGAPVDSSITAIAFNWFAGTDRPSSARNGCCEETHVACRREVSRTLNHASENLKKRTCPRLSGQIIQPDWYRQFQCRVSAELVHA
jgi:hypothetical protein